nr:hypothetical protein [Tanacetum cinerariifolium]
MSLFTQDTHGSKRRRIHDVESVGGNNAVPQGLNGSRDSISSKPEDSGRSQNLNEGHHNVAVQQPFVPHLRGSKRKCANGLGNLNEDGATISDPLMVAPNVHAYIR